MPRRALLSLVALGGIALTAAACAPPAQPVVVQQAASCDTSFRVNNVSSGIVEELYFSHASLNGWGADQLGTNVLAPGRSASFRAANTGSYDFKVVWTGGRSAELRGVNICAASTITVTNAGLRAS